ncbi:MAG: type II toxin-antitoxin system HicB family antitoxin [Candidatus Njordarchaeota archaeon]
MVGKVLDFDVVIIEDEMGGYVAFVPALPGCHTQGETIEETIENVKEAIELYLETLTEEEKMEILGRKIVRVERVSVIV